jgi:predicted hydrocarbon binding protein
MHGIIFTALKKYVRTSLGGEAWNNLRAAAGLADRVYLPVQPYPDEEFDALVTTVAQHSGISQQQLLQDFGRSMVPDFVTVYRPLIAPDWRTLDLLEHIESRVHAGIRLNNPGAEPPVLRVERAAPDRVVIRYESPKRWCALGKGLIQGIADHYGERIQVAEERCMSQGEPFCELVVTLTARAA